MLLTCPDSHSESSLIKFYYRRNHQFYREVRLSVYEAANPDDSTELLCYFLSAYLLV